MKRLPQEIIDKILVMFCDFQTAVELGNSYCINKLYNKRLHTISWACVYGHLNVIKYLENNKKDHIYPWCINYASMNGCLHIVQYLSNILQPVSVTSINLASMNGHLDIVKYLCSKIIKEDYIIAKHLAEKNNHKDVLDFLSNITKKE